MKATPATVGIDLGGSNTKLGLLVENALRFSRTFPTQSHRSREAILRDLETNIDEVIAKAQKMGITVEAIGIGVPATIARDSGQMLIMPNFAPGWFGFPIVEHFANVTGLKTALVNDARAFVLAESLLGAATSFQNVFGIVLGTGVGGGVVLGGRLYLGAGALAGEVGHLTIEPHGVRCGCGSVGCLETVASAPALAGSVTRAYLHGRSPILYELTKGDANAISASLIVQAAREGELVCLEALERVAQSLGIATANAVTFLAPECIVIGGGLSGASDILFPIIRDVWQKHLCVVGEHLPELRLAQLQEPGVVGAALYAREHNN